MLSKPIVTAQLSLFFNLSDTLNQKHPLFILTNQINWQFFEDSFSSLYSADKSRPAKPIRLTVGLLILKHIGNISDESVVEQWSENIYYQYFCGETSFVPGVPCEASELVHFRNRIGEAGIELILQESIRVNGRDSEDEQVNVDTTVQEKNITFPTDTKLHKKIIRRCQVIAEQESVAVRQSYRRTMKRLAQEQRFRHHPKNKSRAKKADKKIRTIAGRLVRELERKLSADSLYHKDLKLYKQVLSQSTTSKNKIYSLHEPEVCCISKGKEHQKYEFGNKVSIVRTDSGVIVGAMGFRNEYDGHTLAPALAQVQRLLGKSPKQAKVDRGYKGQKSIGDTQILIPSNASKNKTDYQKRKLSRAHRKRAGIEPVIGRLKTDHRLKRSFYKGIVGDNINVVLAAAAFNFKRMLNKYKASLGLFWQKIFRFFKNFFDHFLMKNILKLTF